MKANIETKVIDDNNHILNFKDYKEEIFAKSGFDAMAFWASDSGLALQYFHTMLGYFLIGFEDHANDLSTMRFSKCDDSNFCIYVHFNKSEEREFVFERSKNGVDDETHLRLIPVSSSDIMGCPYLHYTSY